MPQVAVLFKALADTNRLRIMNILSYRDLCVCDLQTVLERLVEKGKIMVKRAYADWNRYAEYKRPFHEHAQNASFVSRPPHRRMSSTAW